MPAVAGEEESAEGLMGALARVGDAGRLLNTLVIGVSGVLDGRSILIPKFLKFVVGDVGASSIRKSLMLGLSGIELGPVGTEGSVNAGFSSSSSIGGKFAANPERSKGVLECVVCNCGEDEGEDDGDGGPKEDVGTNVWDDCVEATDVEGTLGITVEGNGWTEFPDG